MLKVKNKKVVSHIAGKTYKANRKKNMLTVLAIFLTTFLIAVVISIGMSYWDTLSLRQVRMEGMDYDIELSEPEEEQAERIRSMDRVKYAGVAVKCAIMEQYKEISLDKTRLFWVDQTCWEKQVIPALEKVEGTYPKSEKEIMLSHSTLKAMGINSPQIGMTLPVDYFTLREGANEEILSTDFILCGWFKDYSGDSRGYVSGAFCSSTGVKQTDFTQGSLKINLNNPLYSEADIVDMQQKTGLRENQIIAADYDTVQNFCKIIAGLAAMLCMIFVSGYLFIFNTLYISISKDIRYYGQLKTLGMTSSQLKGIIYRQAIWNALYGIPAGLLAAAAASRVIIPRVLHIVNPALGSNEIVQVQLWVYGAAGIFSFATNLISSRKPAKIAADCEPVEAMRYTCTTGRRKIKKQKSGGVFSMAVQNMFRDKKQAVIIFLSFLIAVSLFLIINVVIRENDAKGILNQIYDYDMEFKNMTTLAEKEQQLITDDKIAQIRELEGVKCVRKVTSTPVIIPFQENVYGDYFKEVYKSRYSPGNYEEDMELYKTNPEHHNFITRFTGIDKAGFEKLNKSLGNVLEWKDFEEGKIAIAAKMFTEGDNGIPGKTVKFLLPEGLQPDKEHTIQIAAVTENNPAYFAGGYTPDLIVSEKYAQQLMGSTFTELAAVDYTEAFHMETEQRVKEVFAGEKQVSTESKLDQYMEMKNSETQVKVLGNSIGFIIAMLAMLNYINMMTASIQNRTREFATLESIGMTSEQLQKMLVIEGAGYGISSVLMGLAAGFPISYGVFHSLNIYGVPFAIPWASNLILFAAVVAACVTVPVFIFQRSQRESILVRLKEYVE